jgi:hypothetical protein
LRVANIQEYANSYDQIPDKKADELIQKTLACRKQRSQLLATYYERVKKELGENRSAFHSGRRPTASDYRPPDRFCIAGSWAKLMIPK